MKSKEEPFVIFLPRHGFAISKRRKFVYTTDLSEASMWVDRRLAALALTDIRPEAADQRRAVAEAQVLTVSEAMAAYREWQRQLELMRRGAPVSYRDRVDCG
jgi:hypothetical protein